MALALAVLAVLATVAPEQAVAQSVTTFISNTGQTRGGISNQLRATAFTTGTGTYTLSSVAIAVSVQTSGSNPTPVVQIYGDTGGNPGTLVATLTNPATVVEDTLNIYTAPLNTTLAASTTYWLVTSNSAATNGMGFRVNVVANTNLDSGTAAGWSIGNTRFKSDIADASWSNSSNRIQFQIRGTSAGTNTPPTASNGEVTATEDTDYTFTAANFNFSDTDAGAALSSVKITSLPASGKGMLEVDGTAITSIELPKAVTKVDIDASKLTYVPPANADGDDYATFQFKVNDGRDDSAIAYTMTIDVTAVNDPPTGQLALLGQPESGATLTLDYSAIMDADGLPDLSQSDFNWYHAGTSEAVASNTTSYTLITRDVGKQLDVIIEYEDNGGGKETVELLNWPDGSTIGPDATPPTLTSATVGEGGNTILLGFSENIQTANLPPSSLLITADGSAVTISDISSTRNLNEPEITFSPLIRQGQVVVVTYTDPTGGNDTRAIEDIVGNDAASFTTGLNSVPAVTNNSTVTPVAPGAPTGLTATASGSTQIDLSWTAPADNGGRVITGYKIEISSDGGNVWTDRVATTGDANTTYAHTGLAASTTRHYRVSAINTIGTSTASNTADATTGTGTNTLPTASNGEVTATEDTEYTFTATDFNFSDSDAGAALSSVKITSLPASGTGTLEVDGTVIASGDLPKTVTKVDIDASKLTYSPTADANGDDYATFQFKVNDGTDDSATASTMTIDVTAVNDTATGQPGITGTAQVGQLLTAAAGTIADPDGLPNPFLTDTNTSFQWVRVTSGTDDDISGETASTYTLVTADEGKTIKVKVSFQDGGGGSEGPLTSVATAVVSAAANTPATGAPTITGTPQVGERLTAATTTIMDGDGLNNVSYTYQWIRVATDNTETDIGSATASTYTLVGDDQGKTIKVKVSFTDDANNSETLTSVATAVVSAAANTPATGAPTITGTPQVGERLTAATTTIMDGDGLNNVSYTYQWIRVATDNTETDIGSATASTYTLVTDDQGKTIKVKVSFTDDANNSETLTSVATAVVSAAANTPATGAPTITGTPQVGERLTAATTTIMDGDGLNNVSYTYQWIRVATDNTETDIGSATASTYTLVTDDQGKTIKVKVSFTDDANNSETLTSVATAVVSAAANTPATGAPTITGTPQVGERLTAATTTIMDGDGLNNVSYTYQWIRVATDNTETDIGSATASTYTLVTDDQGKTIKVKVSFTDDANNSETLTSVATAVVSAAANTPATGAPTITGTPQVGERLTAATTTIMDGDGLNNVSYTYQWIRVATDNTETDIGSATASTYTLVTDDQGKTIKVKVSFTDDANNSETLTSVATAVVSAAANTPATGAPTITGTPQVGERLTAATTTIMDGDGLNNVSYTYQWIRVATDNTETDIGSATASTYTLVTDDQGKTIKVKVSFTDDANNSETLTSVATAVVSAAANTPATGAPTITGTPQVGERLTAATTTIMDGDGLNNVSYTYQWIRVATDNTETDIGSATASTYTLVTDDQGKTIKVKVSFTDDANNSETLTSVATAVVSAAANTPATGAPTITGTPQVGERLTAATTTIMDGDGLNNVSYTYQWIRVATDNTETNIASATASTYTLVTDDQGKTIKVKVSFTDDANNSETLTSEATAVVSAAANTPATGAPTITGTPQVGERLTAATTTIMDGDGLNNVSYTYQWIRVATDNTETNIASATASTYTLVTDDQGKTIKVKVSFTDDANNSETLTSVATAVVSAAANTPATGAPTITGTPQVGERLTAATTTIMDGDGLNNVSYTYQWIRVDGGTETDISPATASTYTLVGDDQGKTIKVKVSFTDDANNSETLTSVATAVVSAAANTPATGAPTITGTPQVGERLTAATTTIMDGDGLNNVSYTYQWIRVATDNTETNIGSATASTYTLVTDDQGKTIKVKVSFTDDANNSETLTSVATAVVSAAANTPATGAPTITGTPQVGERLTAATTTIMDGDGLNNVSYTYQWIRVATDNTETNIGSATASTYTLVTDDQGKTIKVKVSFTDDANNSETLTSVATAVVSAAANTPATGAPTITGTPQVGERLTAATTTIMDGDGLNNVSYTYQWIRVATDNTETDIGSATASTYTLVTDDQGKTIKVKVSFTDDANNSETLTSVATAVVSAAANTPATGAPTITGTPQVGERLTAATTTIMDGDGLNNVSYTYQWIRVATDNTETNIGSATASTYTLVTDDQGKTIKVKVSFTDDANNSETLTSVATAVVSAAANTPATGAPTITGTPQVGERLTAATTTIMDGDGLNNVSYTYQWIRVATDNTETDIGSATASTYTLVTDDQGKTIKVKVSFTDDANNSETLTSVATAVVSAAANTPATGAPTITGTPQVGERLTAATTTIMDGDGLNNVSYTYQWIRVDGGTETDISPATASTYTLVGDDQGKTIKVKVSFTDDANNSETLTSVATAVVSAAANTPATGAPTITGTPQVGERLTAATTTIMDGDGLNNVSYTYQWIRVATDNTETNIGSATASTYTLVTDDQGKTIKVKVSFTDDANNSETLTSVATAVVSAAANTPATGAPTITGTPQVGERLTAATTTIMDGDGLNNVSYTYQWIRVATDNTETDIGSATASTYTLVTDDQGKTIKVKVSFTDDANNSETLTSVATAVVSAAANTPATGAPTITGTPQVGERLTAATTTIMDGDGLNNVSYTYQWIRVATDNTETNIGSATASTYTLVTDDQGKTIKVKVSFTDDANNSETLTSVATAVVSAAANTPATGAPTITGTPQVGERLTAATTTIMDGDGLNNVSYTYQWIRVATDNTETDIGSATASTYTLVTDDQGKTIKVKVSFTDDANNSETLTSVATAVVSAAANTPATGAPTITGTPQVGERLTAATTTIMDGDGLNNVSYTYQWIRVATDNTETDIGSATASTYTLVTDDQGKTIKVKVSFTDDANNSETLTSVATAVVSAAATVPGAPRSLSATASGTNRINLTWSAPASNGGSPITGYRIEVSLDGGSNWTDRVANTTGTNTSYAHTGLAAGDTRHYRVSAINDNGTGNPSNIDGATTGTTGTSVPGAPTRLTATASGNTRIDLSWNAPASDGGSAITGYRIKVSPNGTSNWTDRVANTNSTTTTYADTGLAPGTTRHYRVSAINANGTAASSNTANATTDSGDYPQTPPGAPEPLTATAGDGEVFLEWTAPADDGGSRVTGYEYRYAAGDGVPRNKPWRSAGRILEWTVAALTNGQQYAFEVRARNDAGPGAPAHAVATPLLGVPGAPEPLTATAGDGEVFLEWTAPAAAADSPVTGYEYRYAAGDGVPEDTPWQSVGLSLEGTVAALTRGRQYAFEVRARNRVGPGAPAKAVATPVGVPSVPGLLTATSGDGEVLLEWTAPVDDGGTPVTGYEYRYAAGAVPEGRRWRWAGKAIERTVNGLTNGLPYAFEVRARNRVGEGRARAVLATPVGVPGAPATLTATAGDGEVGLAWSVPADNGGSPVTGYEYRYTAGAAVPESTPWQSAGLIHQLTVTGLTNGLQYAFEVRARNRVGEGEARGALATPVGRPGAPASLKATAGDKAVALLWSAPVDDGGTPVTGYEYRYAAGAAVPEGTPWQSAGQTLLRTVTGLSNGQPYAFEVRALNRVGGGEARGALATPVGPPGAPASLAVAAGDGEVGLAWSAPADDGGMPVTGYEYRHAAGDAVPGEIPWREANADRTAMVTGLDNETRYAFEVRARNRMGPGETSRTTALPLRLRAELFSSAAAEGEALVVGVRRSGGLAFEAHATIGVTDNALPGVTATEEGRGDGLGRHRLEFAAGEAEATVTVTVAFDGERRQDRALTVTLDSAAARVDGMTRAYEPVAPTLVVPVTEGDAGLSVADARVQGKSAMLAFTVSMDRTRDVAVRVNYATEDGSARAGEDYTPVAGTLTIAAGGREGTVEVPVLPALHVTGERTLTLKLSNAGNAVIDDGMATGTIARTSELPKAWLARFGRTASDHAAQAIGRRVAAGQRETHVTVAGRRLDGLVGRLRSGGGGLLASTARNMAGRATSGLAATAARSADPDGPGAGSGESAETLRRAVLPGFGYRLPEVQDALLGSSFYLQGGAQQAEGGGGAWAAWGDVATTHFEGAAGDLGLNGDVTTGTVGLDRQWRKLLVGLAFARSGGEGAYGEGAGTITSTLTSVHPYLRYRLAERAQLWGTMGWGRGGLSLTPGRGAGIETDLSNAMAALGGRAVLRRAGATGSSLEIALRSDLLWTSTSSDRAGVLAEATGRASRGRLMLEGAGRVSGLGGVLRHSVEGGLRYDGGDAETGAGLEVGGGLDWARGGLVLRVNGRMLLAYADDSYEEWGYGGSLIYEPGDDGRGLRMRLGSSTGATASGVRSLWALENASGLVRGGDLPFEQRFDAEVGFGLGASALWYPYLATDASGQRRFGLRLNSDRSLDVGVEFGRMNDGTQPSGDALLLRGDIRF